MAYQRDLDRLTIGPRLDLFEGLLGEVGLLDTGGASILIELRRVVSRLNEFAHGTLLRRAVARLTLPLSDGHGLDLEWVLVGRRTRQASRMTMAMLREDLGEAIGAFAGLLAYAECFVSDAPWPRHFAGGHYLAPPTPQPAPTSAGERPRARCSRCVLGDALMIGVRVEGDLTIRGEGRRRKSSRTAAAAGPE